MKEHTFSKIKGRYTNDTYINNLIFKAKNSVHRGFLNNEFEFVSKIIIDSQFSIRTLLCTFDK